LAVDIVEFSPGHLVAAERLWERMYARPRGDAFYRWSLLNAPGHRALVAMEGDECVAMLRAFDRDYRLDGRRVTCRETFDWLCAPEHRRVALGLRVMRTAMSEWAPLVNVGGTEDTLGVLPALRWAEIGAATYHSLPLGRDVLGGAGAARMRLVPPRARGAALSVASALWFRPRRAPAPAGGEVVPVASVGEEVLDLYEGDTGYGALRVPDVDHLRWLIAGHPSAGQFAACYFTVRGALRGWGLTRAYTTGRALEAALVDVYAPRPTPDLYAWMVSELVVRLAGHSPSAVRAQATCPTLQSALRRLRFLRSGTVPVFFWSRDPGPPPPLHFTFAAQDGPMLPYPERWPYDEPAPGVRASAPETARTHA
jgi:Acetyltransferase (GNAT) domain